MLFTEYNSYGLKLKFSVAHASFYVSVFVRAFIYVFSFIYICVYVYVRERWR